jgi:hypothetical protein
MAACSRPTFRALSSIAGVRSPPGRIVFRTPVPSDIDISQSVEPLHIKDIAGVGPCGACGGRLLPKQKVTPRCAHAHPRIFSLPLYVVKPSYVFHVQERKWEVCEGRGSRRTRAGAAVQTSTSSPHSAESVLIHSKRLALHHTSATQIYCNPFPHLPEPTRPRGLQYSSSYCTRQCLRKAQNLSQQPPPLLPPPPPTPGPSLSLCRHP